MEKEPEDIEFGKAIRIAREEKGLTQERLAKNLKMSPATISGIESGARGTRGARRVRHATLRKIADGLELNFAALLRGDVVGVGEVGDIPVDVDAGYRMSTWTDIRETLERYPPLRGHEKAIDYIMQLVEIWTVYYRQ